jgi:acyl-[acyl-carrier-protein]-phospholipid O-acyltransferase/long-chain-fatty-acid--[acyl-carrier-protein] ligase
MTQTATARAAAAHPERPLPPLPGAWKSLGAAFVRTARARAKSPAMSDSTGTSLTYGDALLRAAALGRVLRRETGGAEYVGVMVPPTVHGAVANLALTLNGQVPVNLNYTAGKTVVDASIDRCGIRHVVTSRRVVDKFHLEPKGDLLYLEDMPRKVGPMDKAFAAFAAKVAPLPMLGALLPGARGNRLDEPATVIFTSGSTGDPKGVVLHHRNVLSNILQIREFVELNRDEVVLGVLPFFHSFGFTVTIWTVFVLGFHAVYHFSPLDSRIVGNLCEQHKATILFATPTFMRGYLARCERQQFATMRLPVLGAEKLNPELAQAIRERLGIEPLEGYGCTETGPVVAVNVPHDVTRGDGARIPGNRPGTVGLPLPGTSIKTVDPDTGADLPPGAEGLIHVRGPQVMAGYLGRPEETAKVLKDGWYNTGDLGGLDAEGFLRITDRLSRFSKVGGEMVPHQRVEAAIAEVLGAEEGKVAVTALPDPKRGERLVVVHAPIDRSPAEVCRALNERDLPKLWLPSAEDFVEVEALPVLGTGKLDLRALRQIAQEKRGG